MVYLLIYSSVVEAKPELLFRKPVVTAIRIRQRFRVDAVRRVDRWVCDASSLHAASAVILSPFVGDHRSRLRGAISEEYREEVRSVVRDSSMEHNKVVDDLVILESEVGRSVDGVEQDAVLGGAW